MKGKKNEKKGNKKIIKKSFKKNCKKDQKRTLQIKAYNRRGMPATI